METLELLGDGLDGERVMAWMLFPNEQDLRRAHIVRKMLIDSYIRDRIPSDQVKVPVCVLQSMLDGPSQYELHNRAVEATKQGTVAGDLLALIYEMHLRGVEEPSFGKAIANYKKFALGRRYGDRGALKRSEATLRRYFDSFESVAHLWAALRLNQGPYPYTSVKSDVFHSPEGLQAMLGVAKAVGEFATKFIPKRTKPSKPVISLGTLVKIPEEITAKRLSFKHAS